MAGKENVNYGGRKQMQIKSNNVIKRDTAKLGQFSILKKSREEAGSMRIRMGRAEFLEKIKLERQVRFRLTEGRVQKM